jgi:hypothetical protein
MDNENFILSLVDLNTVTKSTLAIRTERNTMQRTQELCILLDTLFVTQFPHLKLKKKTKLCGLSPRVNYTDRPLLVSKASANFYG